MIGTATPAATAFRQAVLEAMPANVAGLANAPSRGFAWPTLRCSIGCAHCNFASTSRRADDPPEAITPAALTGWLVAAGASAVVLCGGGEPLDEPHFCTEVIRRAASTELSFGIYTSGISLAEPQRVRDYVETWRRAWAPSRAGWFALRLSLDTFHADRVGLDHLAEWIAVVRERAPEWRLSLRGLRLEGDTTPDRLASLVGGSIERQASGAVRMRLPDGGRLTVERMGLVLDGRATLGQLSPRGLRLPPSDARALEPWTALVGRVRKIGRPLSRRLTIGSRRVDLELHPDCSVHMLESTAFDTRRLLTEQSWADMRAIYYRDPLVHAVAVGGLPLVAEFIRTAITTGVAPPDTVPFSIERIADAALLDYVSALAVVALQSALAYPDAVIALARRQLAAQLGPGHPWDLPS